METLIKFSSAPYPGLRPFRYDESDVFFGREAQTDQLLMRLSRNRFLAVTGASGCGKSSLMRAGMIPALRAGFMADVGSRWRIVEMHPGGSPFSHLARALCDPVVVGCEQGADHSLAVIDANLRRGPLGLIEIARATAAFRDKALLVLVDQFEELFRFGEQIALDEADAFVALLLASAQQRDAEIYVVITMRSDYLGGCARFRGLAEAVSEGQYLTPRLTREELEQAIARPARVFGGSIEPMLVNRLLNDFGSDPDQLPLLQHALMRMWSRCVALQATPLLTVADYEAIGGLTNALSNHADEAFGELTPDQQRIDEILFKRLSGSEDGPRDVRSPTKVSDVAAVAGVEPAEVWAVLEVFTRPDRCFLVVDNTPPDDCFIDISHESLIRQWRRLKAWVQEESEDAVTYRRLRDWALRWREGKAGLWRGPDLAAATVARGFWSPRPEAWAARYGRPGEFQTALEFLDASIAEDRAAFELEEVARKQQLRRARLVALVCGSAALLLIGGILGYWFGFRREHAEYFKDFVRVYGVPKGIGPLTARQIQHRPSSLKITTRGIFGNPPVIRMESVDAAGRLANDSNIETDFEATSGAQALGEARWEYVYDNADHIAAEVAFDRDGKRLRSTIYSPYDARDKEHRTAYMINGEGSPHMVEDTTGGGSAWDPLKSCAEYIRFDYSAQGYEAGMHYLDRVGRPTPGRDGAYILEREFDDVGHVISLMSKYRDGRRMNDRTGNATMRYTYNASGDVEREEALDAAGVPVNLRSGDAMWQLQVSKYDAVGNAVVYGYQLADGRPGKDYHGCTIERETSDLQGRAVAVECLDEEANAAVTTGGYSTYRIQYDENGRNAEYTYFDAEGKSSTGYSGAFREALRYDQLGHEVEFALYSADSQPVAGTLGFHKRISTYEGQHKVKTEYLDVAGKPVATTDGKYAADIQRFDPSGNALLETYLGVDGRPVKSAWGYATKRATFDSCGRETEARFLDEKSQLSKLPDGYAVIKREFDDDGNLAAESFFDETERPVRTQYGYARETSEYNHNRQRTEEDFFDQQGRSVSLREGYATLLRKYDDHNLLVEESYLGLQGQPVMCSSGWAAVRYVYNSHGQEIEETYLGIDGQPLMLKDGYATHLRRYDARDVLVEESYLGPRREPVMSKEGWARATDVYDLDARTRETIYFGTDDQPIMSKQGYAIVLRRYDERRFLIEESYFGPRREPVISKQGWARAAYARTPSLRATEVTYFGTDNRPLLLKEGYAKLYLRFDERDNALEKAFFGLSDEPAVSKEEHFHRMTRVLDKQGNVMEVAYFGTDDGPLEVLDTDGKRHCARYKAAGVGPNPLMQCFNAAAELIP
jgi:hypothetical protein